MFNYYVLRCLPIGQAIEPIMGRFPVFSSPPPSGNAGINSALLFSSANFCAWGHPFMTSAKFLDFLTPSPPCPRPHLVRIYSTKCTQPPLLHLLLAQPPSPLHADVINGWPLRTLTQKHGARILNGISHPGTSIKGKKSVSTRQQPVISPSHTDYRVVGKF